MNEDLYALGIFNVAMKNYPFANYLPVAHGYGTVEGTDLARSLPYRNTRFPNECALNLLKGMLYALHEECLFKKILETKLFQMNKVLTIENIRIAKRQTLEKKNSGWIRTGARSSRLAKQFFEVSPLQGSRCTNH